MIGYKSGPTTRTPAADRGRDHSRSAASHTPGSGSCSTPAGRGGLRLEAVLQAELAAVRVAQGVALARHREQQRARRDRWLEREAARPERRP